MFFFIISSEQIWHPRSSRLLVEHLLYADSVVLFHPSTFMRKLGLAGAVVYDGEAEYKVNGDMRG